MVASIVLKKIYLHGICALSKKYIKFHAFLCVRSKNKFYAIKMLKKQNLTHPKAAKLATLSKPRISKMHTVQETQITVSKQARNRVFATFIFQGLYSNIVCKETSKLTKLHFY